MATRNGAKTLPTVLDAYRRLLVPAGGWKLVVVDSASTDQTGQILANYEASLPLTCLRAVEAGKNRALNIGLSAVQGDLVVFTDDDAAPTPDWLVEMRCAADEHPEFDIFGGAIVPWWERVPEPWLLNWVPMATTYTITDAGLRDGLIRPLLVCGPNMAVRASLFERGHRFDESIGPKAGSSYAMGSETEFTVRMDRLGHRAGFASRAVVRHMIRTFQMERRWILRRAVRYGRGLFRRDRHLDAPLPRSILGMPRWMLPRLFVRAASLAKYKLLGNAEMAFRESWELHFDLGYLLEARAFSRESA